MMNIGNVNTINYLVPAEGNTQGVQISGQASSQPYTLDWDGYAINNQPFVPQGVFIDNTQGTAPLVLVIGPLGYTITVATGATGQYQFPAPRNQTATITGQGQVSLIFVNFPVLPDVAQVSLSGTANVSLQSVQSGLVVPTQPTINNNGQPYQVQQTPSTGYVVQATLTTGTTVTLSPSLHGLNLRKLLLSVSDNVSTSSAQVINLTASLNGSQIFREGFYAPAAAGSLTGVAYQRAIAYDGVALNAGGGSLVITTSAALTSGQIDINAYFA